MKTKLSKESKPKINPFTSEPPVMLVTLSFLTVCRVKISFKPYQHEHDSVKEAGENGQKQTNNACIIVPKIPMKILFH